MDIFDAGMDVSDVDELGLIIKAVRKAQKLTQEQLAAQSGVGIRFLRELESGKPSCQVGKALQVLTMLGLNMRIVPRLSGAGNPDFGAGFGDGSGDGRGSGSGAGSGDGSGYG
ncbi:MAG: helix-turn-helix domain-containing protein [Bdellovibrionales bacterium]